jgi:hypothetical protein
VLPALVAFALAGCSSAAGEHDATGTSRAPTSPASATTTPGTSTTGTTTTTAAPAPAPPPPAATAPPPAPTTPAATTVVDGSFRATIAVIDDATRARMPYSWRPGCPVGLEDLRLVTLTHWDFALQPRTGELVLHEAVAADVVEVFRILFHHHFPVERMELVDVYGGSDDRSVRANNTSAFNCRAVTGGTAWSEHAYGRAVDVNPVQNPYVRPDGTVLDPASAPYVDRSRDDPGMVHDGDIVVRAFAAIGWGWGGHWSSTKDYQHFSATGR